MDIAELLERSCADVVELPPDSQHPFELTKHA